MLLKSNLILFFCLTTSLFVRADDEIPAAGKLICRVEPGVNVTHFGKKYDNQQITYFNEALTDLPNDPVLPALKLKPLFITVPFCDPGLGKNKDACHNDSKRYIFKSNDTSKNYLSITSYDSVLSAPAESPEFQVVWKESYVSFKKTQFVTLGANQYWGSQKGNKITNDSRIYLIQGIFYEYVGDLGTMGFNQTQPVPSVNLRGVIKYRYQGNDRYWAFSSSQCKLNNW